ncbi:cytidine deaminase [Catenaria anguillulae PL171]|uniref:Cytidine deaminase n=1 Tax=Catenaria anguillulae PL171 TaxID=765915 RepID=A0A1Y2H7P6_9FUNG|nr:cytidine deaminase [Catenaria anguillulae PL171]
MGDNLVQESFAPAAAKVEPGQASVGLTGRPSYTDAQRRELMATAVKAKDYSYSPYSKFRVGAGLLTESGKIYMGCNVENASYGGCICAERTVYVKAVSEGHTRFPAIAVATDLDYFAAPCGMCRQFMAEFGTETVVILTRAGSTEEYQERTVGGLLPESFGPKDLQ